MNSLKALLAFFFIIVAFCASFSSAGSSKCDSRFVSVAAIPMWAEANFSKTAGFPPVTPTYEEELAFFNHMIGWYGIDFADYLWGSHQVPAGFFTTGMSAFVAYQSRGYSIPEFNKALFPINFDGENYINDTGWTIYIANPTGAGVTLHGKFGGAEGKFVPNGAFLVFGWYRHFTKDGQQLFKRIRFFDLEPLVPVNVDPNDPNFTFTVGLNCPLFQEPYDPAFTDTEKTWGAGIYLGTSVGRSLDANFFGVQVGGFQVFPGLAINESHPLEDQFYAWHYAGKDLETSCDKMPKHQVVY